jgi:hypothetical protein
LRSAAGSRCLSQTPALLGSGAGSILDSRGSPSGSRTGFCGPERSQRHTWVFMPGYNKARRTHAGMGKTRRFFQYKAQQVQCSRSRRLHLRDSNPVQPAEPKSVALSNRAKYQFSKKQWTIYVRTNCHCLLRGTHT